MINAASEDLEVLLEASVTETGFRSRRAASEIIATQLVQLFGCSLAVVRVIDPRQKALRALALHAREEIGRGHVASIMNERLVLGDLSDSRVKRGALPPSLEAFMSGEVQLVTEVSTFGELGPSTMCVAPLVRRGSSEGVVALYWQGKETLSESDLVTIRKAARLAAISLEAAHSADGLASELEAAKEAEEAQLRTVEFQATRIESLRHHVRSLSQPATAVERILSTTAAAAGDPELRITHSRQRAGSAGGAAGKGTAEADFRLVLDGTSFGTLTSDRELSARQRDLVRDAAASLTSAFSVTGQLETFASGRPRAWSRLSDPMAPPAVVQESLSALGISEQSGHVTVVSLFKDSADAYAACDRLQAEYGQSELDPVIVGRGTSVLACVPGRRAVQELTQRIVRRTGHVGTGSSDVVSDTSQIGHYIRQAGDAARISEAQGGRPVSYAEVGPMLEITASMPSEVAVNVVDQYVGPLERYDAANGSRLVETLSTYLAADGGVGECAKALHVHPNTVKQRLSRISGLLGTDVRSYSAIARLSLALEWRALFRGQPSVAE